VAAAFAAIARAAFDYAALRRKSTRRPKAVAITTSASRENLEIFPRNRSFRQTQIML
jgi:hypothetical protein